MLAHRLDKLENDLQQLITMHDLYLQSDTESVIDGGTNNPVIWPDDVPVRDMSTTKKQTTRSTYQDNAISQANHPISQKESPPKSESTHNPNSEQLLKLNQELTEEVASVKARCKEVEESAKHVYIQLQKVQEDVRKEKEMKESLLVESMRVKGVADLFQAEIEKLKSEAAISKVELEQMEIKVQSLSTEKANMVQKLFYLCHEMGYNKDRFGYDVMRVHDEMAYFDFLKNQFEDLKKRCTREDRTDQEVKRMTSQANILVGRCATLEKERNSLKSELMESKNREEHLKNRLNMCQMAATTVETEVLKKQVEYECILQKVQSEAAFEKNKFSQKLDDYSALIKKSKELLLNMRAERDQSRQRLNETLKSRSILEAQLQNASTERNHLSDELEKTKRQLGALSQDRMEYAEHWQIEKMNMTMSLKRVTNERKKCMTLLSEMKNQLVSMKAKCEHDFHTFSMEKERLLNENKRLDENARVLQKISEDNAGSIGKLRGEIEDLKRVNFKLDSQIREYESTENSLIRKLEHAEKQCDRYARRVDELEEKICKYERDLREHDCDEYVDSKYREKAKELEVLLKNKREEWQETLRDITKEKEQAMGLTRESLEKIEEMKKIHETNVANMKTKLQAELGRVQDAYRKKDQEKLTKIHELQSKLDRLNLSSSQIQRALSTKIKQLQAALGICLGGSNPHQNMDSISALSQIHQIQNGSTRPVAAFGNAGSCNKNCCANSAANLLNVDGGQTECHTCFTFANPPPVVSDCTSADFSTQPCSTSGSFDVQTDLFGTLML